MDSIGLSDFMDNLPHDNIDHAKEVDAKESSKLDNAEESDQAVLVHTDHVISPAPFQMIPPVGSSLEMNIPKSQFELAHECLPSLNPERSIVLPPQTSVAEQTPLPIHRIRPPGPYNSSSYITSFGSETGSSSGLPVIFELNHPFIEMSDIVETELYMLFWKWLNIDLLAKHNKRKNNEDRKKRSIRTCPPTVSVQWIATLVVWCMIFGMHITNTEGGAKKACSEETILEYINGYRLHATVPWHMVDNIFIPVNVREWQHWVLVVISFDDRCLMVYDSIRSTLHNPYIDNEVKKYAQLIPMYLSMSDFYRKKGLDVSSHPKYTSHSHYDSFEIKYVNNIAQQPEGSMQWIVEYMSLLMLSCLAMANVFHLQLILNYYVYDTPHCCGVME